MSVKTENHITKEELAILADRSVATINEWIKQKKVTPIRIGKRCYFDKSEIIKNSKQVFTPTPVFPTNNL